MARDYGRIRSQFWTDEKVKAWSIELKAVAAYLMTSEHANALGAFRLPAAYMSDDLGIMPTKARQHLADLHEAGWLRVCFATGWIWIVNYLKHNKPENVNVEKHVSNLVALIPENVSFLPDLIRTVSGGEARVGEPFRSGSQRVSNDRTQPLPEPEPEPLPEPSRIEGKGASAPARLPAERLSVDLAEAVEAYNAAALDAGWQSAQHMTPKRRSTLKARISDAGGLSGWVAAMGKARASPFLRGETGRAAGHENWRPNLDFFLKPDAFTKLMEGVYDRHEGGKSGRSTHAKPALSDDWMAGAVDAIEALSSGGVAR